jgi:TctA family transporter
MGLLPGVGGLISSFVSYVIEKKVNRHPEKFGKGYVAGVAAPEAANNAGAQTSFIPMLSMGLPTTPIMALMIATLTRHNLQPGPQIISQNPGLFWGLIASMWIGNLMLLILNLPLIGVWTNILRIPRWVLYPLVIAVSTIGTYYINNNWFDVMLLLPFALLGYIFKRLDCEPAPLAMGFIVGPMFEEHLRRMLTISNGQWDIILSRPLSLTFVSISMVMIFIGLFFKNKSK